MFRIESSWISYSQCGTLCGFIIPLTRNCIFMFNFLIHYLKFQINIVSKTKVSSKKDISSHFFDMAQNLPYI